MTSRTSTWGEGTALLPSAAERRTQREQGRWLTEGIAAAQSRGTLPDEALVGDCGACGQALGMNSAIRGACDACGQALDRAEEGQ